MHEDEFVQENEEILRRAATSPEQARQVEDLIAAALAVSELRLLTEIWWPTPEQAMRQYKGPASRQSDARLTAALTEFKTWQESARALTQARLVLQEIIQIVPELLWQVNSTPGESIQDG